MSPQQNINIKHKKTNLLIYINKMLSSIGSSRPKEKFKPFNSKVKFKNLLRDS